MGTIYFRIFFVFFCSFVGYLVADVYFVLPYSLAGSLAGIGLAFFVFAAERSIRTLTPGGVTGGVTGLLAGLVLAFLFDRGLLYLFPGFMDLFRPPVLAVLLLALGYLGLVIGAVKGSEVRLSGLHYPSSPIAPGNNIKILDTSVIIDGRFAEICDTGFIDGILVIPRFVLEELQGIADSSDSLKRSRGRHGLDTLNRMKNMPETVIEIVDIDFPKIKAVDAKLVALAKQRNAAVVTNDYNLNKVAEIQGVTVLNVNDLANALKPMLLPGESFAVKAVKEGKEPGQAVAYLEDGTMVIIDGGVSYLKKNVDVVVTSVLQTTAGRMIFTRVKDEPNNKGGHHNT